MSLWETWVVPHLGRVASELIFLATLVGVSVLAARLLGRLVPALAARCQLPPLALRPLLVAGRGLVVLIAASSLASRYLAIDLFPVIGGLLGLVAVGFVAVWSVVSNTLCTLLILMVRPFRVGDHLELPPDPIRGTVVDMNLFFTQLQTDDGRSVQVPNNLFFQRILLRRAAAVLVNPPAGDPLKSKLP